jgi:hypothetical protein
LSRTEQEESDMNTQEKAAPVWSAWTFGAHYPSDHWVEVTTPENMLDMPDRYDTIDEAAEASQKAGAVLRVFTHDGNFTVWGSGQEGSE